MSSLQAIDLKYKYALHLQRLMGLKKVVNQNRPPELKHLDHSRIYNGAGPKKSLDERITFIQENNCLANRIISVGRRRNQALPSLATTKLTGQSRELNSSARRRSEVESIS